MDKKNKNVHSGHRERMLNKYKRLGADAFESHELLEMLLYYCVPRINTNETAHQLIIDRSSLAKAIASTPEELTKTKGVGPKSALLISLARDVSRCAELEKLSATPLDSEFRRASYIFSWFKGKPRGVVMAMFLDENQKLIETATISAGRLFRPDVYPPIILDRALSLGAEYVILAHNHWDNCTEPSLEDLVLTGNIRTSLGAHKIGLINHYIVTENNCIPTSANKKENKDG